MYVLHGLAGVGLIALVMVHVYMGIRPEKFPITKSMIFGWMSRDFYLEEHDPERWAVKKPATPRQSRVMPQAMATEIQKQCETIEECYEFTLSFAARGLANDEGSELRAQLTRAVAAMRGLERSCAETVAQQHWARRQI